jgi:recombination protein RecA
VRKALDQVADEVVDPARYRTRANFEKHMEKKYGKGVMVTLSDNDRAEITHWCSTGVYGLDDCMAWGIPGGRWVEYFGEESSGKTTGLMATMVENEYRGGNNVLADPEGTFNEDRYGQMGGDPKKITLLNFKTHEEFYDVLEDYVKFSKNQDVPTNALNLIGVDSYPMLIPAAHLKAEGDTELVAVQARINSRNMPRVNAKLAANTAIIILNQVRDKVGSMAWTAEGNIETPGGHIIKHMCSVRVLFNKVGQVDNGKTKEHRRLIGIKIGAKVVKNKVGPPLRKAEFRIMFDHRGVDSVDHVLQAFMLKRLVKVGGPGLLKIKEETVPKAHFAKWLAKHPKWCAWALEQTFELYHPDVNVQRYV